LSELPAKEELAMRPIDPLMAEHRVIERMIRLIGNQLDCLKQGKEPGFVFLDSAVDFMKTYADRCHHGKEEEILFRDLARKTLSGEHDKIMKELIHEHVLGRNNTLALVAAGAQYAQGDVSALAGMIASMERLAKFYPMHIEKEEKRFFVPCMEYFDDREKDGMLEAFWAFDKGLIHEKYSDVVEALEK